MTEATAAYQNPRLVRLGPNLWAACFTLMKLIPARYILRRAAEQGLLTPDTVIVETTSGTFGLALAMQAVHLDRRLVLVSDPAIDERLYRRLTDLGAVVDRVPKEAGDGPGGFQTARLNRLAEVRAGLEHSFCPEQYTNPDNPRSYAIVSELLRERLGRVDCVVGPVGSGGSMCGTVTHLRRTDPHCRAIGVDTHGSVLFGQPEGHRELRGLGMSVLPANLDHRVFDDVHWCSAAAAYQATRELHQSHALFMGPTSGAAYLTARWWAQQNPDAVTVVMMPDEGYRYQDTVYDDAWLAEHRHDRLLLPAEPKIVDLAAAADAAWTGFAWGRRSYGEVVGP
ncbi:cysteine synthase family protein [Nonomuraea endophytica]|uniref:cysteine synthase family protein n=1 Tax=Nonomuraea endophytica TaxID=714136 RepID=UPI0037C57DED